jgi:hypothetical protein
VFLINFSKVGYNLLGFLASINVSNQLLYFNKTMDTINGIIKSFVGVEASFLPCIAAWYNIFEKARFI